MSKTTTSDIHSYTVFANIDKRDGSIEGHMIVLSKEQLEAIEDIIVSKSKIKIKEDPTYTIEE